MDQKLPSSIWWIRRDLRLTDNPALQTALQAGHGVTPVFVLDPYLLAQDAPARKAFLFAGLRSLDADLRHKGSRLVLRSGNPLEVLPALVQETGAQAVYALEDYSPYARSRDDRLAERVNLNLLAGVTVHPPAAVRKSDGSPYTVFTPFSRAWKALPLPMGATAAPESLPAPADVVSEAMPQAEAPLAFPAGEKEALARLERFLNGQVDRYHDDRNRMDLEGTSSLSPYFRFGMLSPRLAAVRVMAAAGRANDAEAQRSCETWLNELIWREFYTAILAAFPYVLKQAFNPALRGIDWRNDVEGLRAWQSGQTGVPSVDASMRQLMGTGWMHNRGRMITASYLTKDLLINWQEGERWFMRWLVDGDPASNNGGWQWTAGVGTDAAPYFRIFNPVLQGQKCDPQGVFIRKWVPELARVPDAFIQTPWLMPQELQREIRLRIGVDYPAPIVDHADARQRTLAAYSAAQKKIDQNYNF